MTGFGWSEAIGLLTLIAAGAMVVASQHGIGTRNTQPAQNRPNGDQP